MSFFDYDCPNCNKRMSPNKDASGSEFPERHEGSYMFMVSCPFCGCVVDVNVEVVVSSNSPNKDENG